MKEIAMETSESLLKQADAMLESVDRVHLAREIYQTVAARRDGLAFGDAMVGLSLIAFWAEELELSAQFAAEALGAPTHLVRIRTRAVAGVRLAASHYQTNQSMDLALLEHSARTAILEQEFSHGALGLDLLGRFLVSAGNKERARAVYDESAAIAEQHGWFTAAASTLCDLAQLEHEAGESERALAHLEHSIVVLHRHPLKGSGTLLMAEQRPCDLIDQIRRDCAIEEVVDEPKLIADITTETSASLLEHAQALMDRADHVGRARDLFQAITARRDGPAFGDAMVGLSTIAFWEGETERSAQLASDALDAPPHLVHTRARAVATIRRAAALRRLGRPMDLDLLERSAVTAMEENESRYCALGFGLLAEYLAIRNDTASALVFFERAAELASRQQWYDAAFAWLRDLARLEYEGGNPKFAIAHLEQALALSGRKPKKLLLVPCLHPMKPLAPIIMRQGEQEVRELIAQIRAST
jgi:tetratricopeptide (TPR) repeat protein